MRTGQEDQRTQNNDASGKHFLESTDSMTVCEMVVSSSATAISDWRVLLMCAGHSGSRLTFSSKKILRTKGESEKGKKKFLAGYCIWPLHPIRNPALAHAKAPGVILIHSVPLTITRVRGKSTVSRLSDARCTEFYKLSAQSEIFIFASRQ